MKPKTKPKIKESIEQLEHGQSVEFRMDSVKESTVRSTCSRLTKSLAAHLYRVATSYPVIKVTRL